MAMKKDPRGVFGRSVGAEVFQVPLGGGFAGGGYRGAASASPKAGGAIGNKTSAQARAAQSGSDLVKNFRASGKAGSTTKKSKSWFGW